MSTGEAQRKPNAVLRGIRETERRESQAEFAEAMAQVAREMGVEAYPDWKYVQRLESGRITWPHRTYRNILEQLCERPSLELGFAPSALSAGDSGEMPTGVNVELREAVWQSGMELAEFARKVGVHLKTAERWITRGVIPQPFRRWRISLTLGIDESELWPDATPHQEIMIHTSDVDQSNSIATADQPQDLFGRELPDPVRASLETDILDAIKRRAFSMGIGAATGFKAIGEAPVSMLVRESTSEAVNITTSAGQELISPLVIEQFFEDVSHLSVLYNASTAGVDRQILERATLLRGAIQKLSAVYRKPSQSSDLYLMTGLLSGICSYACLDLGYPDEAMAQARATFMMGDMIGHDGLRAWAAGTRSLIARFQGRYADALEYARQGIQYATTGTALVRLRCGEGQTLAHMGDSASAIHYLNLAKEARENIASSDVLDGLFSFSEAKQTYYSGSSLQWLPGDRNAKAAEAESARAIHMFQEASPDDPSGDELLAHIYLGNSRLTLGEIEGSMDALRPVLDLPSAERNAWQRKRMQQLALRLKSGSLSDSRLAITARDEISAFIETP